MGVREDHRVAVLRRRVEEGDRRGGGDRRLFGEDDDGLAEALADDRARAELARLRGRRRRQFPGGADRQALRLETSPFLSNQIVTVSTIGGGVPSLVPIFP
ncbi:MAG: hypothetical protein E6G51_05950 [Actinobacteria bacterium]|nr:MAG: hypothetical protein E6G51_05950 [Actinomycetota bacterium]